MIRTAEHNLPCFAEFDFLPRILHRIEPGVNRDAEALGLREKRGHPLQHGYGLLFQLRLRRAGLLRTPWYAQQQQREGPRQHDSEPSLSHGVTPFSCAMVLSAALRGPQGIMSHSNSLLAIGAATRL